MVMLISAQIVPRLIGVVSLVWEERVRAESYRTLMEAAGNSGTVLCERHADGTVLMVIPSATSREQVSAAESLVAVRGVASAVTAN
jgi:hypothetical protein